MEYKGVKLYSEADKFMQNAGNLVAFCHPPNVVVVHQAHAAIASAISALSQKFQESVHRNYPNGGPGTIDRKKHNWTISQIKRSERGFKNNLFKKLKANVWKG